MIGFYNNVDLLNKFLAPTIPVEVDIPNVVPEKPKPKPKPKSKTNSKISLVKTKTKAPQYQPSPAEIIEMYKQLTLKEQQEEKVKPPVEEPPTEVDKPKPKSARKPRRKRNIEAEPVELLDED